MERVQKVAKLISVEGYFSEIYTHEDYKGWFDSSWFTKKKALVRVKAKVSIGFDMEGMKFNIDDNAKTIKVSNLPDPEILSIDHELDYYDLQEGLFNTFSERDLTDINVRAKYFIQQKAMESDLFLTATEQEIEFYEIVEDFAKAIGYTVIWEPRAENEKQEQLLLH